MELAEFKRKPLLGIVRGIGLDAVEPVLESAIAGGLESLEITMNTRGAPELIARAKEVAGGTRSATWVQWRRTSTRRSVWG